MKRTLVLGLAAVGLAACQDSPTTAPLAGGPTGPSLSEAPVARGGAPEYVPGELLVKFRAGASESSRGAALRAANATVGERVRTAAMERGGDREGISVVRTGLGVPDAIRALRESPDVEYAEPNWIYQRGLATESAFRADSLWGLYGDASAPANAFGSQAAEAWAAGSVGSDAVYVGIIDEGVQVSHPDLAGNVWTNPYDPADGRDNDGNGLIDDVNGWDFDGGDNSVYDGGTRGSLDDHGTHVAGTIGAVSDGKGVVGVNWNVTMISAKFLGRRGGTTLNAIKAVDYFTDLKIRHKLKIVATNNSWGGGGYSQGLYDAIERANSAGILFIAAAGNGGSDGIGDNNDVTPHYPSTYSNSNIIAVASITKTGAKSAFSNFGATTVDIAAPGSAILSTTAFNTYSVYSGTSMATPHVTGAVALYASVKPAASAAAIKTAILTSAITTGSVSASTTGGRLDANGALLK